MSKVKNAVYQDAYNPAKTWQVCYMNNGFYLKQFIVIGGKQYQVADKSFCFKHGVI